MPLSSDRHIIDDKFREALEHYKVHPSGSVWNRLSSELFDLDTKRFIIPGAVFVASVFLAVSVAAVIFFQEETPHQIQQVNQKHAPAIVADKEVPATGSLSSPVSENSHVTNSKPASNFHATLPICDQQRLHENNDQTTPENITAYVMQPPVESSAGSVVNAQTSDNELALIYNSTDSKNEAADMRKLFVSTPHFPRENAITKPQVHGSKLSNSLDFDPDFLIPDLKGWYLGLGANFNSTWIIDKNAISSTNVTYIPSFGVAYELHGGYNFSNTLGLELRWVMLSNEGQRYKYNSPFSKRSGEPESQIALQYMQWPLLLHYKIPRRSGLIPMPFVVNYVIGVQYGRLIAAQTLENGIPNSYQDYLRKNEYAFVAGIDYDFLTKSQMFFTLGAQLSYGSNIFERGVPGDLDFVIPHNLVIGVHGALNFAVKSHHPVVPE